MSSSALTEEDTTTAAFLAFAVAGRIISIFEESAAPAPAPAREPARQTGCVSRNLRREQGLTVSDGNVAYEMVALHAFNISEELMGQMMALQEKIALVQAPDTANFIDYKSENEIADHYANGGLGLGVFNAYGKLIGQAMLSFNYTTDGPFAGDGVREATIGWLMVDPAYRGNLLCESLIDRAMALAAENGAEQIAAHVRLHNEKGIAKFAATGFVAAGTGDNAKDGSPHVKFYRTPGERAQTGGERFPRPFPVKSLQESDRAALFNTLANEGLVAKWDHSARWFTVHSPVKTLKPQP